MPYMNKTTSAPSRRTATQTTIAIATRDLSPALTALPIRRLLKRDVLLTATAVAVLGAPAVVVPLMFSPINAVGAMQAVRFESRSNALTLLGTALGPQLAWPVLVVAAAGALRAVVQRNPRAILFLVWVAGVTPAAYLFSGGAAPQCATACDTNGDGALDLADAVYTLMWLFSGGSAPVPAAPGSGC